MPENPKVMFKRGLQSALLNADGSAKISVADGSFYLTTDTNRLYVGNGSNIVELNKSITVVDSVNDLPKSGVEVGQFYYIKGSSTGNPGTDDAGNTRTRVGNILAVVTEVQGGVPTWVQVNPDTNDNDNDNEWVSSFSITRDATNAAASNPTYLRYNWTLTQKDEDGIVVGANPASGRGAPLSGYFDIPIADIVSSGVNVGLSSSKSGDNLVITPTGTGANTSAAVTLVAGDNIAFNTSGNNYSIDATNTTYDLTTDTTNKKISLREDETSSVGSLTFAEGTGIDLSMTASGANGTLTITHENVTRGADTNSDAELSFGGELTVVTGITTNAQGHVTQVATRDLILPEETDWSITSISADNQGKLHVTYSDGLVPTTVDSTNADLFFTYGDASTAASNPQVVNQGNLPVYTRAEIDGMVRELNGMTYRGVVTSSNPLPSSNVKNGDTYKVGGSGVTIPSGNGSASGNEATIGDLLIAHGTEGSDGYITNATLAWDYIPSGDETDTQYQLTASNNIITLAPEDVNSSATPYNVTLAGGNKLTASTANNTITINHDAITSNGALAANATAPSVVAETLDYGDSITAVIAAKADGYGHITDVYTKTFTLPESVDPLEYSFDVTASSSTHGNGKIALKDSETVVEGEISFSNGNNTTAIVTQNGSAKKATVQINHNTLTPTATDSTTTGHEITINTATGFNAISSLSFDSYGHVSGYTTQKYLLPDDVLLTLNGSVTDSTPSGSSNTKATVALSLNDEGSGTHNATGVSIPTYSISTSSLKIATTAATSTTPANIAIDIEWGTF